MEDEIVYRTVGLTKRYPGCPRPANDGLDLAVRRGEVFALLGANGAGKTTLVRQLMGLVRPTSGSVLLDGQDIAEQPDLVPRQVSYMPQRPYAFNNLTIAQALFFTGRIRGLGRAAARSRGRELLDEWGLTGLARNTVARLSGGQQRLAGICLALVGDLPVLVLDEPTNDLDPIFRRLFWQRLGELRRRRGATVILVTHNVHEAEQVADRVAVLREGRLAAVGSPAELKARLDGRARLRLAVSERVNGQAARSLARWGDVEPDGDHGWLVLLDRERLAENVRGILAELPAADILDFHIQTTTLEDLFWRVGGHGDGDLVATQG